MEENFLVKNFKEMLYSYGSSIQPTRVKNPQTDTLIERTHLLNKVRIVSFEGEDWISYVDQEPQTTAWKI